MKIEINLHIPDGAVDFAKRWLHRRNLLLGSVLLATLSVGVVHAWTQFSAGGVVSSTAVNANFAEVQPDRICATLDGSWDAQARKCALPTKTMSCEAKNCEVVNGYPYQPISCPAGKFVSQVISGGTQGGHSGVYKLNCCKIICGEE